MDRAEAVVPTAAALTAAVARRDTAGIALILRDCADLHALAVVLADNVGRINDHRLLPRQPDPRKSRRKCLGCGTTTRSSVGLCADCGDVHSSPRVLRRGRWVTERGVARYVA